MRNQDSKLRNQNGKLKSTPLKPLTLQNRYARAFCAHRNSRARGSTIFETFKAQNAEICTPPRPCPPAAWTPKAKARARGSTNFRNFQGSKCRNLYSPGERGSTNFETIRMPKSVLPRAGAGAPQPRGQSTGTGQYDFRDFQGSKSQKSVLPRARARPWTPEAKARARGSTNFETLRLKIMPKSVLPRARGPQPPWIPCKFGKTFTSCHPHLRWSHSSPFRQHWSHTALVSGKSDDETACCSPIPHTFEALVRLPHNLFDVLAALLWQPHELVDVLGAFFWFQPSLPGKG